MSLYIDRLKGHNPLLDVIRLRLFSWDFSRCLILLSMRIICMKYFNYLNLKISKLIISITV